MPNRIDNPKYLERLRKTRKCFIQDIRCPGRDSNLASPEYDIRQFFTTRICPIHNVIIEEVSYPDIGEASHVETVNMYVDSDLFEIVPEYLRMTLTSSK
jgi:hypothetical protein